MRIWAAKEILKRNLVLRPENIVRYKVNGIDKFYNKKLHWGKSKQEEMIQECISICSEVEIDPNRKRAARVLLEIMMGIENANNALDGVAVVTDRNDPLVTRWRKSVLKKYKKCVVCGSSDRLHAHHISHWADDPVNRISLDNGIVLCNECHAKEHPEISNLILSN